MKPNSLTAIVAGLSPGTTFLRTTRAVLEALALINVLTLIEHKLNTVQHRADL